MNGSAAIRVCRILAGALLVAVIHPAPAQDVVIRSNTNLVQVNVVVHDKKGNAVGDLQKGDFEVFENGKPQRIVVFALEQVKAARRSSFPPHFFTNQFPLESGARTGYTVILLDWLNGDWKDRAFARQQVVRLLHQIQTGDLLTLCVLNRTGLAVLHDFTAEPSELVSTLSAARDPPSGDPGGSLSPFDASLQTLGPMDPEPGGVQFRTFEATRKIVDTLNAFRQIAAYMAAIPGHKSLVWVTTGFPSSVGFDADGEPPGQPGRGNVDQRTFGPEFDRSFQALGDAGVAVYPVDARGLVPGGAWANISTMKDFAAHTGGRAYYNRNDLDTAIRSAIDDSSLSYTLGYYAPPDRNDGSFHEIRVNVRRPGLDVRHRRGYLGRSASHRDADRNVQREVEEALTNPLEATALPLSARADIDGPSIAVQMLFNPADLSLRQDNGRWNGSLVLEGGFRMKQGSTWTRVPAGTLTLNLRQDSYETAIRKGIVFRRQFQIPQDAGTLRLVVRDLASGALGSLTIDLDSLRSN